MTAKKRKGKDSELTEARNIGRDEGAAWAVAQLVNMYGTSTESMELAQAWGMKHLLKAVDESDLPHLKKLIKDYPKKFPRYRALRAAERKKKP